MQAEIKHLPDTCSVRYDGELLESRDFVAILAKEDGDTGIYYSTDALTLGIAMKMIAKEFVICLDQLTATQQLEIAEILGDAFIKERLTANEQDRD